MEVEGMYAYRYRSTFLILKMTIKVVLGFLLLFPILGLIFGKKQFIEFLLNDFFLAIFFLPLTMVVPVFIIFFVMFYIGDKPLIFPMGHPLGNSRKIRTLSISDDSSSQSPINQPIPNPAMQIRFVTPKGALNTDVFYFFPCSIFFPRKAKFYHKLLNGLWLNIPYDAQNGEIFRCRGLFKTRNSIHQEVRGDIYIEVAIVRSIYYYLLAFLGLIFFFIIFALELIVLQSYLFQSH